MTEFNPFPPQLGPSALPDPVEEEEYYEDVPLKRVAAFCIDTMVSLLPSAMLYAWFDPQSPGAIAAGLGSAALLWMFIFFPYRLYTIYRYSATPGMLAMGIEFRNHRGDKFTLGEALTHTFAFWIVCVSGVGPLANAGFVALTRRNQSIPDLFLGSTAINAPE